LKIANTAARLKQIMNEDNLKQVDIVNKAQPYCKKYDVKLNKSDISQYVSGKFESGIWDVSYELEKPGLIVYRRTLNPEKTTAVVSVIGLHIMTVATGNSMVPFSTPTPGFAH